MHPAPTRRLRWGPRQFLRLQRAGIDRDQAGGAAGIELNVRRGAQAWREARTIAPGSAPPGVDGAGARAGQRHGRLLGHLLEPPGASVHGLRPHLHQRCVRLESLSLGGLHGASDRRSWTGIDLDVGVPAPSATLRSGTSGLVSG